MRGGKREGAGRPNPWGEPLLKITIRLPSTIYRKLQARAGKRGVTFSHALTEILDRIKRYL